MSWYVTDAREAFIKQHVLFCKAPTLAYDLTRYMVIWQPRSVLLGHVSKIEVETSLKVGRLRYHIRHPKRWRWEAEGRSTHSDRIDYYSRLEATSNLLLHYENCTGVKQLQERNMLTFNRCPFCGDETVTRCKCPRADCMCSKGHHWHWSLQDGVFHEGESTHDPDPSVDCCVEKKVFTPYQKR
jgi:predicted RNA-binding Zn-ribbon protein involved in translation (DUF1610 family)